jgi:hypothetical protein
MKKSSKSAAALPGKQQQPPLPPGHSPYSRRRPRKHGYAARISLRDEEEAQFNSIEEEFYNEYRPTCATESALLDEVVINYWRFQRARDLESRALEEERDNLKLLALYFRYRASFESSFYRALRLLNRIKAENRRLIERYAKLCAGSSTSTPLHTPDESDREANFGFVSQNTDSKRPSPPRKAA